MEPDTLKLSKYLEQFATEERLASFEKVLENRTRHLTVALENIYQPHNASAVMRSCDCFGIQDVHVIENSNEYRINPGVALGATKWISLHKYNQKPNNTSDCIKSLKNKGYTIVATTPHTNDVSLEEIPIDKPIALFFGAEKKGLSKEMMDQADVFMKIPMFGFTESFNISVSAALCLHVLSNKIRTSNLAWQLSEEERNELYLDWLRKSIDRVDVIERDYLNRKG